MIVLLKTPTKYREFFPTLLTSDFQLVFNFEQTAQLPCLERMVQCLKYTDSQAYKSSRIALSSDPVCYTLLLFYHRCNVFLDILTFY